MNGILKPHSHEPRKRKRQEDGGQEEEMWKSRAERLRAERERRLARLQSNEWCKCPGGCEVMPKVKECLCCREIDNAVFKMEEKDQLCITLHSSFPSVCLDPEVLWTGMVAMMEFQGKRIPNPVSNW